MKKIMKFLVIMIFALALMSPHDVDARAGGGRSGSSGGSMGSRGSHTYQSVPSYNAAPVQRSVTPRPAPAAQPMAQPAPAYVPPPATGHPFLHGMLGGFVGAGLAGMLFGHGGFGGMGGYGGGMYSPTEGFIGGLLQLLLIGGVVWFVLRWFRNRNTNNYRGMTMMTPEPSFDQSSQPWGTTAAQPTETTLTITPDDHRAFQDLLVKIQTAWGQADLSHLRQYLTPEMLQYFSEELSANTSRGEANHIADVSFIEGNLAESWSEAGLDYATLHLRWKAIDYMARLDRQPNEAGYVVSGDTNQPTEAQEIWTFARARNGGHWLLSAIQQVA